MGEGREVPPRRVIGKPAILEVSVRECEWRGRPRDRGSCLLRDHMSSAPWEGPARTPRCTGRGSHHGAHGQMPVMAFRLCLDYRGPLRKLPNLSGPWFPHQEASRGGKGRPPGAAGRMGRIHAHDSVSVVPGQVLTDHQPTSVGFSAGAGSGRIRGEAEAGAETRPITGGKLHSIEWARSPRLAGEVASHKGIALGVFTFWNFQRETKKDRGRPRELCRCCWEEQRAGQRGQDAYEAPPVRRAPQSVGLPLNASHNPWGKEYPQPPNRWSNGGTGKGRHLPKSFQRARSRTRPGGLFHKAPLGLPLLPLTPKYVPTTKLRPGLRRRKPPVPPLSPAWWLCPPWGRRETGRAGRG